MPAQPCNTIIQATTDAVTTKQPIEAGDFGALTICADNLATTETVGVYIDVGGTWKAVTDTAGTAQTLTASIPALSLQGGPRYGVIKDATAGACGVYFYPAPPYK